MQKAAAAAFFVGRGPSATLGHDARVNTPTPALVTKRGARRMPRIALNASFSALPAQPGGLALAWKAGEDEAGDAGDIPELAAGELGRVQTNGQVIDKAVGAEEGAPVVGGQVERLRGLKTEAVVVAGGDDADGLKATGAERAQCA